MAHRPHPGGGRPPDRGVWKHKRPGMNDPDVKLADFSYQNVEIANMIVKAWSNPVFRDGLLNDAQPRKDNAIAALGGLAHPIVLTSPIVITEAEYDDGWDSDDPDQVVFVLPNRSRQVGDLLESAKLLMAAVPNGI